MKELDKLKTKLYMVGGCKKLVQEKKQRKERKQIYTLCTMITGKLTQGKSNKSGSCIY